MTVAFYEFQIATFTKLHSSHTQAGHIKWPLTGGVPSPVPITKCHSVDRVYLAGYHDGSVRIWDATYPVLKLICALDAEVRVLSILCPKYKEYMSYQVI